MYHFCVILVCVCLFIQFRILILTYSLHKILVTMDKLSNSEVDRGGDCIKIFVRVRPAVTETNVCLTVKSEQEIILQNHSNPKLYQFDHVADQVTTQETVFSSVGRQIVESCVEGYNGTIFAYGQTGSGKTYTMLGPGEDAMASFEHRLRGIIPRSLQYMFELIQRKQEMHGKQFECTCRASFLEIYNEQVFDLLDPSSPKLQVRESKNRGVFVEGIIEKYVTSGSEAFNILSEGWCNRRVASTSMNRESSRSHAVFTVTVETKEHTASITKVRQSVLNLVDLAGSERQKDTLASGTQLKEAGKINGSLSVLGQVIMELDDVAHNKTRHISYRNSKLTFLLRDSLGGNAKTFIIVNVHPNAQFFGETTSTLQFAARAKQIKNRARVNENTQGDYTQLQTEIERLKAIICRYESSGKNRTLASISDQVESELSKDYYYDDIRQMFFNAMQMNHRLRDELEATKNHITKMNNFNMSRNFIIKLRDSKISELRKGKTPERDEEIEALKKELQAVKDQLLHNPEVALQKTKITELQHEVEKLRQTTLRVKLLKEQEKELDQLYEQLLSEMEPDSFMHSRRESVFDSNGSTPNFVNDAADKAKIAELEQKLKSRNDEFAQLEEKSANLEAELKSTQNQVKDLEGVLHANLAEDTMQRRRLSKMHENAIIRITTPKRKNTEGASSSRSKIARGSSIPSGLDSSEALFDDDFFLNVSMLTDQKMPEVMEKMVHEELQEELQQVKQEMEKFKEESLSKDCDLASVRKSENTLMEKLALITQNLSDAKNQLYWLEADAATHKANLQGKMEELDEARIMLESQGEVIKEYKDKEKSLTTRITNLEAELFQKQIHHSKIEKENEDYLKEAQTLEVDVLNQKLELEFFGGKLKEKTQLLESEQIKNKDLIADLKEKEALLVQEKENCFTLQQQLEGESKTTSEQLSLLRNSKFELEKRLAIREEEITTLNTGKENLNIELENVKKERLEDQIAIKTLHKQYMELQGSYFEMQNQNIGYEAEIEEFREEMKRSESYLEKERKLRETFERKLNDEREVYKTKESKYEFQMESLQEDVICWNEQYSALDKKLKIAEEKVEDTKKTIENLQKEINKREEIIIEKGKETEVKLKKIESLKEELVEKHKIELRETREMLAMEYEQMVSSLKNNNKDQSNQLQDMQNQLEEAQQFRKHAEEELEKIRAKKEELMTENAALAGHSNHRQKIQYLIKFKEKYNTLEMAHTKTAMELQRALLALKKYEPDFIPSRNALTVNTSNMSNHRSPLKPKDVNDQNECQFITEGIENA
ncbi:uncharacterized protein LOC120332826 [Styela clava]